MRNFDYVKNEPSFESAKKIENMIQEEIENGGDAHYIAKLRQAKLMSMMFNNEINMNRGKFMQPW